MEEQKLQETVTKYALLIFALLIALIIYTFFSSPNAESTQQTEKKNTIEAVTAQQVTNTSDDTNAAPLGRKAVYHEPVIAKINAETQTQQTNIVKDTKTTMKPDDYKIPAKNKPTQKLTDLLPKELKNNIQESLLTEKQLAELTPEDRAEYKKTQRQLAKVLRDLGKTEAENQQLKGHISQVKGKSQQLNTQIEALRDSNK